MFIPYFTALLSWSQVKLTIPLKLIRKPQIFRLIWGVRGTDSVWTGHHGSRALLCLQTLVKRNSWTLLGYLCIAIGRYGKPRKLRTDNEVVFNSFVFKSFLRLAGIQKQTTNVHSPWQNGRMERLFGTLKPVLRQLRISGKVQLQNALDEFRVFYNHCRPHLYLNNETPAQVWHQQANKSKRKQPKRKVVGNENHEITSI